MKAKINKGDKVLLPDGTKAIATGFTKNMGTTWLYVNGEFDPTCKVSEAKKIIYEIGDELQLEMIKPDKGVRPIARTKEGIICLIDRETKGFFDYGSLWQCRVTKVDENKLIVEPLAEFATANEHAKHKEEKLLNFVKSNMPEKKKTEKVVKTYQFLSKNEQRKTKTMEEV